MQRVVNGASVFLRGLYIASAVTFAGMALLHLTASTHASAHYVSWFALGLLSIVISLSTWQIPVLTTQQRMLLQIYGITALWGLALSISGGVMNPANAFLLVPVALAFLTLSRLHAWILLAVVFVMQSVFTLLMLQHSGGAHNLHADHYVGMSFTFYLAALLLAIMIQIIRRQLEQSLDKLRVLREEQLRQEQVLAVATASAQFTHELATPLATLSLLHEELAELYPQQTAVTEMADSLQRVNRLLTDLRTVTHGIDSQALQHTAVAAIEQELRERMTIASAETPVNYQFFAEPEHYIQADQALLPALLNLIRNAAAEVAEHGSGKVLVRSSCSEQHWVLHIENPNYSLTPEKLQRIGLMRMHSESGLGIGMLLSHATLERFSGVLSVHLEKDAAGTGEIVVQEVVIPLYTGQV